MDLKIFKTIAYCYRAVSQNYWVNRALETYDAVFFAMTDLRMPKDPNKPDIVELESRILYSASPFSMWNGFMSRRNPIVPGIARHAWIRTVGTRNSFRSPSTQKTPIWSHASMPSVPLAA